LPGRTIVATTDAALPAKVIALQDLGVQIWQGSDANGKVDLTAFLHDLASMEISSVLLDGGPTLAGALLDLHLIDKCMVFIAPKVFGGSAAPTVLGGTGVDAPAQAPRLVNPTWRTVGDDLLIEGQLSWPEKVGGTSCSQD
jgi:diaminohydroxyphosphoribosylaminopyrimidine deaminase/5-amino-6-(5-phosphoribosylamino)uracil reductase